MIRPKPKKFSEEEMKKFGEQSAKQSSENKTPQTTDPEKYPMFDLPVNGKKVVYVPNYFEEVEDEENDGVKRKVLRMDRGAFHSAKYRNMYTKYRCSSGITGLEGFDGTCPMCDSMPENWQLYNFLYEDAATAKGIELDSKEAFEGLKEERRKFSGDMTIKNKNVELTFCIIDIELQPGTLNPVVDQKTGLIKGTPVWYHIAESTFDDKWMSPMQIFDIYEQTPAGKWFILDYTYDVKGGKATKMKSASSLKVIHKPMGANFEAIEKYFDEMTESWTPALAREVIYANMPYDVASLQSLTDDIMVSTREKLMIYSQARSGNTAAIGTAAGSPEAIAASFGAVPQSEEVNV